MDFDRYAFSGRELIRRIDHALGNQGPEHAGRVLRCVLHALRSRLTTEESLHVVAQLPMAIKGVYVDGWKPGPPNRSIRTGDDFAEEVIRVGGSAAWHDFSGPQDAREATREVMHVLSGFISPGEWSDIEAVLPLALRQEVREWHNRKHH